MWSVSLHPLRRKIWSLNPIYDAKEASDVSSFHDVDKIQAMSPIHGVGKKKKKWVVSPFHEVKKCRS